MTPLDAVANALGWLVIALILIAGLICVFATSVDAARRMRSDWRRFSRAYDDTEQQRLERARSITSAAAEMGIVLPLQLPATRLHRYGSRPRSAQ